MSKYTRRDFSKKSAIAAGAACAATHIAIGKAGDLPNNIWRLRTLRKAMHYYKVKIRMGNQGHFSEVTNYWFELIM